MEKYCFKIIRNIGMLMVLLTNVSCGQNVKGKTTLVGYNI